MMDSFQQIVVSAVGAFLGAAATYWFWLRQEMLEIRRSYDQELRSARMNAYQGLWKEFEPLAAYSPDQDITYGHVVRLGVAIRKWYFESGGLLLTEKARDTYFLLHDAINRVASAGLDAKVIRPATTRWGVESLDEERKRLGLNELDPADLKACKVELSNTVRKWAFGQNPTDDFVFLQFLASSLRTVLARDIRTRDPSLLRTNEQRE
jgi:hypothetical protein